MKIITLICRKCGHRWESRLYEEVEGRRENVRPTPLEQCCCQKCGGFDLEVR